MPVLDLKVNDNITFMCSSNEGFGFRFKIDPIRGSYGSVNYHGFTIGKINRLAHCCSIVVMENFNVSTSFKAFTEFMRTHDCYKQLCELFNEHVGIKRMIKTVHHYPTTMVIFSLAEMDGDWYSSYDYRWHEWLLTFLQDSWGYPIKRLGCTQTCHGDYAVPLYGLDMNPTKSKFEWPTDYVSAVAV